MCEEKLSNICNALKIEAAMAASRFDYPLALSKRRNAVSICETLYNLNHSKERLNNLWYLQYWLYITDGYICLLNGTFDLSKRKRSQGKLVKNQ